ncbi:MAG: DUF5808 domain-containing protein [Streptosporangiaceae bacterium]|jgi:uncharacterized membrane protein
MLLSIEPDGPVPQPRRPLIMVAARFGVGWTLNLGNPTAWLTITGIIAAPAGLTLIGIVAGM